MDSPRPACGRIRKPRRVSQPVDDVPHRIEPRRLADQEARAGKRSAGKDHAAVGAVAQLDALAIGREDHDMLAGHRTTAERGEANGAWLPRIRLAEAVEPCELRQLPAARLRR